jgi:multicomponent Na+:H+ antiporter subunit B
MTPRARLVLLALALLCLAPAAWQVATRMPRFGDHPMPYGDAINRDAPAERHVTNMVTAVNFDYRGLDTLGEEFMLLCAVTGAVMLLRGKRGEREDAPPGRLPGRRFARRADATAIASRLFGPAVLVFGIYVALHATVTPGGGFQGGAIAASGLLLLYLGEGYRGWRRLVRSRVLDACEGGGATLFALAGVLPMLAGAAFLQNVLPLGKLKSVLSGGLMLVSNAGVAVAVAGGFLTLFVEFLEETREDEEG